MRAELANVDWEHRLIGGTVEEQWRIFKEIFLSSQQKYIPVKKKECKKRDNMPRITKEIKENIKLKTNAYRVAKISGELEGWESFKKQQRTTQKAIKKGKIDYESKPAQNIKTDSKSFCKYMACVGGPSNDYYY